MILLSLRPDPCGLGEDGHTLGLFRDLGPRSHHQVGRREPRAEAGDHAADPHSPGRERGEGGHVPGLGRG